MEFAIAIVVLLAGIAAVFIWAPWSTANFFGNQVNVSYHTWSGGGDAADVFMLDSTQLANTH